MLLENAKKINTLNEKLRVVGSLTRHDVRNKLSGLNALVFLLKKNIRDNPEAAKHILGMELASKQIVELLDFGRIYEKLGAEELKAIDVEVCVNEASELSDLKDNQLINQCRGLTVLADSLLRQLLYNLIDNTLRHGENTSQILFYYVIEESTVKLIYEDNGVGIPEGSKNDLFAERNCAGIGRGLYLVGRICEAYGWSVSETGVYGQGVQFVICIPKSMVKP